MGGGADTKHSDAQNARTATRGSGEYEFQTQEQYVDNDPDILAMQKKVEAAQAAMPKTKALLIGVDYHDTSLNLSATNDIIKWREFCTKIWNQ